MRYGCHPAHPTRGNQGNALATINMGGNLALATTDFTVNNDL